MSEFGEVRFVTCVSDERVMLITFPLFMLRHVLQEPNSTFAVWASLFPFATPMVMVTRLGLSPPCSATDQASVHDVATLETGGPGHLAFCATKGSAKLLPSSRAGYCIAANNGRSAVDQRAAADLQEAAAIQSDIDQAAGRRAIASGVNVLHENRSRIRTVALP